MFTEKLLQPTELGGLGTKNRLVYIPATLNLSDQMCLLLAPSSSRYNGHQSNSHKKNNTSRFLAR